MKRWGGGNELTLEVLIQQAIDSGDNSAIEAEIDKVIAGGDKEQIQEMGAKLADSGIEDYSLAGVKTYEEAIAVMTTGVGNLGAFSQPIATLGEYNTLVLNDTDFGYNMMNLEDGSQLFMESNITSFDGKISSLTRATIMFKGCTGLTSWTVPLPESLSDASSMFDGCSGLRTWTVPLPESLIGAVGMFNGCSGLTSWTLPLPESLGNAQYMFSGCTGLTSWTLPLPESLYNVQSMFDGCSGLTSWNGTLPEYLTDARYMFSGCTGLTSWNGTLPKTLMDARFMFWQCKLDLASVQNIAQTINTYNGRLNLGLGCTQATFNDHSTGWYDAVKAIENKGWMVAVQYNG